MQAHRNGRLISTSLIGTMLMGAMLTLPAHASAKGTLADDEKVAIGLGSGVVIGAIVAGPVGAAVAGIVGAMATDNHNKTTALAATGEALTQSRQNLHRSTQSLAQLTREHTMLQQSQAAWQSLPVSVQFASGSARIEDGFRRQLSAWAQVLQQQPEQQLRITGFADHRGATQANLALSAQRAEAVRMFMLNQGVRPNQLHVEAKGELAARTDAEDSQSLFFDRKVTLHLTPATDALAIQAR